MKKIITLLKKKKIKIAIAESCTGGILSTAFTSFAGASKVFSMGLVTYSNKAKNTVLKVPNKTRKKYGAVSMQCCLSMVNNLSKLSKCKICISVTGIAGPKGGSRKKPVGLVFIGIKNRKKIKINKFYFKNKEQTHIQRSTLKKAMFLLLNEIKN